MEIQKTKPTFIISVLKVECWVGLVFFNFNFFINKISHANDWSTKKIPKLGSEMNLSKVPPKSLLMKNSGNNFIFSLVFYLVMWVMKASKNFGKIAIELNFLEGVKTHFGKIALNWCIFRNEKNNNYLPDIILLLLIQLGFRKTKHLKMTIWISALWKIYMYFAKERPEMVVKWPFLSHKEKILQNCIKFMS